MLIAHLIGGAVLLAPFLLRAHQASSTLSLISTAFKNVAPVSFLEHIEDLFSFPPNFIDSPSSHSDVISSPSLGATDLVVYYPPFRYLKLGSAENVDMLAEVAQEVGREKCLSSLTRDEEKPVSTPVAYFNLFILLVPPCAVLTLYLTYVSRQGSTVDGD
jgi:hypothetical protein